MNVSPRSSSRTVTPASSSDSLPALAPQVDELVVVANIPGSVAELPDGTRVLVNDRPLAFAANANRHRRDDTRATSSSRTPMPFRSRTPSRPSSAFMEEHPRCGVAGPQHALQRRPWQAVAAQLSRRRRDARPAHAAPPALPAARAAAPALPARRAARRAGRRATDARRVPPPAPDDARRDRRLGRGFRMYCEDIELNYRAAKAGWERWYVPPRSSATSYDAVDRQALPHAADALARSLRCCASCASHPERLRAW